MLSIIWLIVLCIIAGVMHVVWYVFGIKYLQILVIFLYIIWICCCPYLSIDISIANFLNPYNSYIVFLLYKGEVDLSVPIWITRTGMSTRTAITHTIIMQPIYK